MILSDYHILLISTGLLIPSPAAIKAMALEIRKCHGVKDPEGYGIK